MGLLEPPSDEGLSRDYRNHKASQPDRRGYPDSSSFRFGSHHFVDRPYLIPLRRTGMTSHHFFLQFYKRHFCRNAP